MSVETQEKSKEKVKSMFCEVDRTHQVDDDGNFKNHIASSTPAYMKKEAIHQLENTAKTREDAIMRNAVSSSAIEWYKRQLTKEKKRLNDIQEQTPRFSQAEITHIKNSFSDLEQEVRSAQFTVTDMETMKGINPQHEADRMTEPCIPIDSWLAESCNLRVDAKGKVTRSEAEKALKMAHWHLNGGGQEGSYMLDNLRKTKIGGNAAKPSQVSVGIDLKQMEAINELKVKIADLENKIKEEEWECKEDGCNVMVTKKTKGVHKALHVRQAKKAKELVGKE